MELSHVGREERNTKHLRAGAARAKTHNREGVCIHAPSPWARVLPALC